MKKAISLILSIIMLFSLGITVCVAEGTENDNMEIILQIDNPVMTVNSVEKEIDPGMGTTPVIINERTLLPVRAVVEEMGGTVDWNGDTREVTLSYNEDTIRLTIDSQAAYLNEKAETLDTAPTIINDRTMLPIRFIAEGFGFDVDWNGDTQTVIITKSVSEVASTPEPTIMPTEQPDVTAEPIDEPTGGKVLVAYFSCTGNTESLAQKIADVTGADMYEIVPEVPYTEADLNYNSDCRANQEQNDDSARPAIAGGIENIDDYDIIYIGYPIWWGTIPKIINTFIDSYDLSGKTIMPFCTSGSSGISTSVSAIRNACPNADVKDGMRGTGSTTNAQIEQWIENSNIGKD
ncbi:MAG: NAD(P)H-dependent oxidoreductase [Oscillospiraceae bacterium]|nr:NAD(P)H-dependent oxidoreductase [Oscillospiraceae bacterium]